jgi:hypothetical protein
LILYCTQGLSVIRGSIRTNGLLILYCTQGLSVIRGSIRTNGLLILYCTQGLSVIRGSIRTNGLVILYCTQGLSIIRGTIRTNGLLILYCTQRLSVDSWIYQNKWTFYPVLYTTIKCWFVDLSEQINFWSCIVHRGLSVIRGSIRTNRLLILYCTQGLNVDSWIYQNKWTFYLVLYIKCWFLDLWEQMDF